MPHVTLTRLVFCAATLLCIPTTAVADSHDGNRANPHIAQSMPGKVPTCRVSVAAPPERLCGIVPIGGSGYVVDLRRSGFFHAIRMSDRRCQQVEVTVCASAVID